MNKIYVEVPITTNQTTLSIPCGDDESLWHFTVIFNENEYLHKRLVTVMDNFDDGENPAVQSMLVRMKTIVRQHLSTIWIRT